MGYLIMDIPKYSPVLTQPSLVSPSPVWSGPCPVQGRGLVEGRGQGLSWVGGLVWSREESLVKVEESGGGTPIWELGEWEAGWGLGSGWDGDGGWVNLVYVDSRESLRQCNEVSHARGRARGLG